MSTAVGLARATEKFKESMNICLVQLPRFTVAVVIIIISRIETELGNVLTMIENDNLKIMVVRRRFSKVSRSMMGQTPRR